MIACYFVVSCCLSVVLLPGLVSAQKTQCKENEVYRSGTDCQQHCTNLKDIFCTIEPYDGCFCNNTYVRNKDGKCVPAKECPKESCPDNEVPSSCLVLCNDCVSQGDCKFPGSPCFAGCDCQKGYFRDANWTCIPVESCPIVRCPENETLTSCPTACKLCQFVDTKCPIDMNQLPCVRGCDCKEGYFRDSNLHCVLKEDCDSNDKN